MNELCFRFHRAGLGFRFHRRGLCFRFHREGLGRKISLTTSALLMLLYASASFACPVCFGDSDDPIIKGLEAAMIFMIGMTYFLILSGVAAFILLRRRARRLQAQAVETS